MDDKQTSQEHGTPGRGTHHGQSGGKPCRSSATQRRFCDHYHEPTGRCTLNEREPELHRR